MIKKLIFDLDNTLIPWNDEYDLISKSILDKYGIECNYMDISKTIDYYEENYPYADKELLLQEINKQCNLNLNLSFIEDLLEAQKEAAFYNPKLIELISYLSSKYELVLLSNWFTDTQIGRLEKAGIYNFFTKVYGGDFLYRKPDERAFKRACLPHKPEECIMIGDSIRCDITGAKKVGIDTIFINSRHIICDYTGKEIENIYELKEML